MLGFPNSQFGRTIHGVIPSKSDLREKELLEVAGSLVDGQRLKVTQVERGETEIEKAITEKRSIRILSLLRTAAR